MSAVLGRWFQQGVTKIALKWWSRILVGHVLGDRMKIFNLSRGAQKSGDFTSAAPGR